MKICEGYSWFKHEEICIDSEDCPLCEALETIKEKEEKIAELENEIYKLENEIYKFEKEADNGK